MRRPAALVALTLALVALAATQFVAGGAPEGRADIRLALAPDDICTVEAATRPVLATETRAVAVTPAHTLLTVTPATFGTRTETVTVVPEHRTGATFVAEDTRVIVSEPTRRLRAVPPVFGPDLVVIPREVTRPRVEGGVLVEAVETLPPLPEGQVVVTEARIEAVRINAGLRLLEIQAIDADGEGEIVPAETVEIEVRTVETPPAVESVEVAAVTETVEVETVETPSRRIEAAALCAPGAHPTLVRRVQDVLVARDIEAGAPGEWTPATVDALAAAQAEATGLVSPHLLVETLRLWLPELAIPDDAPATSS